MDQSNRGDTPAALHAHVLALEYAPGNIIAEQYQVEKKLGGGGMGTVYECRDLTLGRQVAIKCLHSSLLGGERWQLRFQQEAKAIGKLTHPSIIDVHRFLLDDDKPIIVMDFVEGVTLHEILAQAGALDTKRSLNIIKQVAEGLAHAHGQGIVHRDLKPGNIMVMQDDIIKILDFGIAKIIEPEGQSIKLTQTGEVLGSPAYMSPEQSLGKPLDGRSDQYSLGCVLYECLTGSPPFVGETVAAVLRQTLSSVVAPMSQASLGKSFDQNLESFVHKLLSREPKDRFATMDEVVTAIRRLEHGQPWSTQHKSLADQARSAPRMKLNLIASIILGALGCALIVGGMFAFMYFRHQQEAQATAPMQPAPAPPQQESAPQNIEDQVSRQADQDFIAQVRANPMMKRMPRLRNRLISDKVLALLKQLPQLRELDLSECDNVTDDSLKYLAGLPLKTLFLSHTRITDKGLPLLAKLPQLDDLILDGCMISDDGCKTLAQMPLVKLSITEGILGEKGVSQLATMKTLRSLDLGRQKAVASGIPALSNNKTIEVLALQHTNLDDESLKQLANMKSLTILLLDGNNFTDAGLRSLENLRHLKDINLSDCRNLTAQGKRQFKKALPGCNVQDFSSPVGSFDLRDLESPP